MSGSGQKNGKSKTRAGKGRDERTPDRSGGGFRDRVSRRLRRSGWFLVCILLLPALWKMVRIFEQSSLFVVREVRVEGCERMTPEAVRALLRHVEGASLLSLDSARISRSLEEHVPIRNASVIKRFPGRLLVRVRERTPAALVEIRDTLCYLDLQGVVLYPARPGDPLDLPLITGLADRAWLFGRPDRGPMVQGALSLLRVLNRSRLPGRLSEIHVDPDQGMSFFLEGFPVEVRVGWEAFPVKIKRLKDVLPRLAADPDGVLAVDLRFRDQVIVQKAETVHERISRRTPAVEWGTTGAWRAWNPVVRGPRGAGPAFNKA
jgi:cell division protein FtsQ